MQPARPSPISHRREKGGEKWIRGFVELVLLLPAVCFFFCDDTVFLANRVGKDAPMLVQHSHKSI